MSSVSRHIKLAPVLLLALFAVGTSVQVGCGGSVESTGSSDDAVREDPAGDAPGCGSYGYGYGYGYGRGCSGYGYGGYGYDR